MQSHIHLLHINFHIFPTSIFPSPPLSPQLHFIPSCPIPSLPSFPYSLLPTLFHSIPFPSLHSSFHKLFPYLISSVHFILMSCQMRINKTNRSIKKTKSNSHSSFVSLQIQNKTIIPRITDQYFRHVVLQS